MLRPSVAAQPRTLDPADIAIEVARRTADPDTLTAAISAGRRTTTLPAHLQWRPHTVAAGFAGTAILFAAVDARHPEQGWDRIGHEHLAEACTALERIPTPELSLFGGLAGIGVAAGALAAGRDRYGRLLETLDAALVPRALRAAAELDSVQGCPVGSFDLISGLTGVLVYLLDRRGAANIDATLDVVLGSVSRLVADDTEPRRWHTPAAVVAGPMGRSFPDGCHNCGLAHGIAGPAAALSIAALDGVHVEALPGAIDAAAAWLSSHRVELATGPDWPNAVALPRPGSDPAAAGRVPGRVAWCYGAAGAARALWLAGQALDAVGFTPSGTTAASRCARSGPRSPDLPISVASRHRRSATASPGCSAWRPASPGTRTTRTSRLR